MAPGIAIYAFLDGKVFAIPDDVATVVFSGHPEFCERIKKLIVLDLE